MMILIIALKRSGDPARMDTMMQAYPHYGARALANALATKQRHLDSLDDGNASK
jgi:hypothetical protein